MDHFKNEKFLKHKKGKFNYSNLGYIILGFLIENLTGQTYKNIVRRNILDKLDMNNSGFSKTNTKLYTATRNKLTKKEKNEKYFASSSGQLKSSIGDLIKFGNFPSLLTKESKNLLKHMYFYKKENNRHKISHVGGIIGGSSKLIIRYKSNWKVKDMNIFLKTIIN